MYILLFQAEHTKVFIYNETHPQLHSVFLSSLPSNFFEPILRLTFAKHVCSKVCLLAYT